jgi:hypothetical protein
MKGRRLLFLNHYPGIRTRRRHVGPSWQQANNLALLLEIFVQPGLTLHHISSHLSAPYRLALRATARLARPLIRPCPGLTCEIGGIRESVRIDVPHRRFALVTPGYRCDMLQRRSLALLSAILFWTPASMCFLIFAIKAHPSFWPICSDGSFQGNKASGTWSWPVSYLPECLHGLLMHIFTFCYYWTQITPPPLSLIHYLFPVLVLKWKV